MNIIREELISKLYHPDQIKKFPWLFFDNEDLELYLAESETDTMTTTDNVLKCFVKLLLLMIFYVAIV